MRRTRMLPLVALLAIGCTETFATAVGDLRVTLVTVGEDMDPDGYVLVVDGAGETPVGVNETVTIRNLDDGTHELELTDVADNCEVNVANPRNVLVTGGATATSGFTVTCHPDVAPLRVVTLTSGEDLPDGYTLIVDGGSPRSIGANDTVVVTGVAPGARIVTLSGIATHCTPEFSSVSVSIFRGTTATAEFHVFCTDGSLPDLPGQIAFSSDRTGKFEIHVLRAGAITRLTDDPVWAGVPAVSPDGTRILFESLRGGNAEIYVINMDGSGATNLTNNPAHDERPSWSPDGSRVLFVSDRTGDLDIFVMNADGSDVVNLTNHPSLDRPAAWHPGGEKIAFSTNRTGDFEIFLMDVDGSNPVNLTNDPGRVDFAPSWSPDATRIAFTSRLPDEPHTDIRIMNADGSDPLNLTNTPSVDERAPSWSPDGTQIVFSLRRQGMTQAWIMNSDGSGLQNVLRSPGLDVPGWPQAWGRLPQDWK